MDKFILYTISICFLISGFDYIFGNHLKLGKKFEEGIKTMGALGFGMIGIYSLAPILSKLLSAAVMPLCKILSLDPSVFPSAFLAVDMGGYQIASKLALSKEMGLFSGIIIASSLGATISFSIPIAIVMIPKEDEKYFSLGIMAGIITIPAGCFAAGLWQKMDFYMLMWNLLPILILVLILTAGILIFPHILIKAFNIFGKAIIGLSTAGLLLQGIDAILGIKIIRGLAPLSESAVIVTKIAFVLGGAYPMLEIINRIFKSSLGKISSKLKINSVSAAGILGNLASNLLVFGTYKEMDPKGKVMCAAIGVSSAFVFGGQLGFVSGTAPQMLGAFIISKFTAGIISILLAEWLYEHQSKKYNIKEFGGIGYES